MISKNENEFIWAQAYRPKTVDECVLPDSIKDIVKKFIDEGEIPHFIFSGSAGCGKTTLAYALADELNADVMFINASLENGIDILRSKIQQFASSVSLVGGKKIVILDEADQTTNALQTALRGFMEAFSVNCRFILTCNHKNKIIDAIHSRCTCVDFKFTAKDKPKMMQDLYTRLVEILKLENVKFEKPVLAEMISKQFPNNRKLLNELQAYSKSGVIDSGILVNLSDEVYYELWEHMKKADLNKIRKWVAKYSSEESGGVFRHLYDTGHKFFDPNGLAMMILIIAKYQDMSTRVADQEINLSACLIEILRDCGGING